MGPNHLTGRRSRVVHYTPILEQNLSVYDRSVRLGIGLLFLLAGARLTHSRTLLLAAGAMAGTQIWEALAGYCLFYDLAGWTTLDRRYRRRPRSRHPYLRARSMVPIGTR